MNKKIVALVLVCVLIFSTVVAGTLAFLMDTTSTVTNTFTFGNVDIKLTEGGVDITENTTKEFTLAPGNDTAKDPKVTVLANSEKSWVFVEVTESTNLDDFISYSVDTSEGKWTKLSENVYYKLVDKSASNQELEVLTGNKVTCPGTVEKEAIDGLKEPGATQPSLAFTAYAVQYDAEDVDTAEKAWNVAKGA